MHPGMERSWERSPPRKQGEGGPQQVFNYLLGTKFLHSRAPSRSSKSPPLVEPSIQRAGQLSLCVSISCAMDGVNSASPGRNLGKSADRLVKVEQPKVPRSGSIGGSADHGVSMAEAIAAELAAAEDGGTGGGQSAATDEHLYQDPASLKWKIFEAVAKANGQRWVLCYN